MICFSIPSDFSEKTLCKIHDINSSNKEYQVMEVYGQASSAPITASGRGISMIKQVDMLQLKKYVQLCHKKNVKFNYTINASCMNNLDLDSEAVYNFLKDLHNIGIKTYTVALPNLFNMIKRINPNAEIKASAICEIDCPSRMIEYRNFGADRVVLDPDITRDFDTIQRIQKVFPEGTEMIVNSLCIRKCPYKMFHYNSEAHSDKNEKKQNFYYNRCSYQKATNFLNYMKINWIRPEDLHLYIELGVKNFKLQGRNVHDGDKILKALLCYFDGQYDGNLLDLLTLFQPHNIVQPNINNKELNGFIEKFFRERNFCTDICRECNYCNHYLLKSCCLEELLSYKKTAEILYAYNSKLDYD